jgi:hypothetical protein
MIDLRSTWRSDGGAPSDLQGDVQDARESGHPVTQRLSSFVPISRMSNARAR